MLLSCLSTWRRCIGRRRSSSLASAAAASSVPSGLPRGSWSPAPSEPQVLSPAAASVAAAPPEATISPRLACAGCGVGLQGRNQVAAGYVPSLKQLRELQAKAAAALQLASASAASPPPTATFGGHGLICQRCFQTKHNGRLVPSAIPPSVYQEYVATLRGLRPGTAVMVQVVDLFDFEGSLLGDLDALLRGGGVVGGGLPDGVAGAALASAPDAASPPWGVPAPPKPLILAINKLDLLPGGTPLGRVESWVRQQLVSTGLLRSRVSAASSPLALRRERHDAYVPLSADAWGGRGGSGGSSAAADAAAAAAAAATATSAAPAAFYLHSLLLVSARKNFGIRSLLASIESAQAEAAADARDYYGRLRQQQEQQQRRGGGGGSHLDRMHDGTTTSAASPHSAAAGTPDSDPDANRYANIYVLGTPNVGKSSLINAMLSHVWKLPFAGNKGSGAVDAGLEEVGGGVDKGVQRLSSLVLDQADMAVAAKATAALADKRKLSTLGASPKEGAARSAAASVDLLVHGADASAPSSGGEPSPAPRTIEEWQPLVSSSSDADFVAQAILAGRQDRRRSGAQKDESSDATVGGAPRRSPLAPAIDADTSALLSSTLREWNARKEGYGRDRASADDDALPPTSSTPDGQVRPPIPFTTSPLPGTTLGVIGAAWDPHGHTRIFDTPGLVVDPAKQALLDTIAKIANTPQAGENGSAMSADALPRNKHALAKQLARTAKAALLQHQHDEPASWADQSEQAKQHLQRTAKASFTARASAMAAMSVVVPTTRPSFTTVRLYAGRSLFLGGLVRIDFLHGNEPSAVAAPPLDEERSHAHDRPSILLSLASKLIPHVTTTSKADALWWKHVGPRMRSLDPAAEDVAATASLLSTPAESASPFSDLGLLTPWSSPLELATRVRLDDFADHLRRRHAKGRAKEAVAPGASLRERSMLIARRKARIRSSLFDLVLGGLGWVSVTPVEMDGMPGWESTVADGKLVVHACRGIAVHCRMPLLPQLATGTSPSDWVA